MSSYYKMMMQAVVYRGAETSSMKRLRSMCGVTRFGEKMSDELDRKNLERFWASWNLSIIWRSACVCTWASTCVVSFCLSSGYPQHMLHLWCEKIKAQNGENLYGSDFVVRQLCKKIKEKKKVTYLAFVTIKKNVCLVVSDWDFSWRKDFLWIKSSTYVTVSGDVGRCFEVSKEVNQGSRMSLWLRI